MSGTQDGFRGVMRSNTLTTGSLCWKQTMNVRNRDGSPNCGLPDPVDDQDVYRIFEDACKKTMNKRQGQAFFHPKERARFELEFSRRMRELRHWKVYWLHRLRPVMK